MKALYGWSPVLVASVCLFSACGEKQESAPSGEGGEAGAGEKAAPELTPAERAEMLGFVGRLSGDVESVAAIYDGRGMVEGLRSLRAWEFIRRTAQAEGEPDPEAEIAGPLSSADPFLGEEFFIALGENTAPQVEGMLEATGRLNYYQYRAMTRGFAQALAEGDVESGATSLAGGAWMMEMLEDSEAYLPWVESFEMPPMLGGLKISDTESMDMAEGQLRSLLMPLQQQLQAETVEFESGGAKFSGVRIEGGLLADQMEADRESVERSIGEDAAGRLISAIREKQVILAVAKHDGYLLSFIGADVEDCPMVEDVGESLAADDRLGFVDGFEDQKVHGLLFTDEALLDASYAGGGLDLLAEGIRDGLNDVDGLGDTRELVALLDLVGERESALLDLHETETYGAVIRVDDDVYLDAFGGIDTGADDFETPHRLGRVGEGENVLLFANSVANEEFTERLGDYLELLVEIAYAGSAKVASLETDDPSLEEFRSGFEMFDQVFRQDVVGLFDALGMLDEGLGNEAALVVDLDAEFPPFPAVPQGIVENGRFVRASYVAPVTDREKLGESWEALDRSTRSLLTSLKDVGVPDLNMPRPTYSKSDDLTTWYFDMLSFSDDSKPSVTINDEWFVASTSRNQALDVMEAAAEPAESPRKGSYMRFDLDVLRKYVAESLSLVDEQGESLFPNEEALAEFREELPRIREGLATLEQISGFTVHERIDQGRRRATFRIETRE